MIDKILESISLTKKDIHGMINDAVKRSSVTNLYKYQNLYRKNLLRVVKRKILILLKQTCQEAIL